MIGQQTSWEHRLLALAHEGLESPIAIEPVVADEDSLEQAYWKCEQITKAHSRTFYLASALLPAEKRRAARALYAFCRVSDDLVDRKSESPARDLQEWRWRSLSAHPPIDEPVALAWADTRARFNIPKRYAEQLIDGVAGDLEHKSYESFEELSAYCYGVASTVGLMAMHITGFSGTEAIPYALKLGVALQLTNILRDVGEDWCSKRLYLPLDELKHFGLSEENISAGVVDDRWRDFMKFQIERTRRLYKEATPGIAMLDPDGRFAIAAAAELYQAILEDIEAHDYDVFNRRAHTSSWGKLRRLPAIWWHSRGLNRENHLQ
jgi:phytoene synthase